LRVEGFLPFAPAEARRTPVQESQPISAPATTCSRARRRPEKREAPGGTRAVPGASAVLRDKPGLRLPACPCPSMQRPAAYWQISRQGSRCCCCSGVWSPERRIHAVGYFGRLRVHVRSGLPRITTYRDQDFLGPRTPAGLWLPPCK